MMQTQFETRNLYHRQSVRRFALRLLFVGLLIGVFTATSSIARADTNENTPVDHLSVETTERFLIHFAPEQPIAERLIVLDKMGLELIKWLPQIHVAEVQLLDNDSTNVVVQSATAVDALELLMHRQQQHAAMTIPHIEADVVVAGANFPDDPDLQKADRSYALSTTHTIEAWEYSQGSSEIIIAVLDTGLNLTHPEFTGRIVDGYDFINDDDEPMDDNGHGTHTAGIIGAGINNGIGMVGVCPQCSIMPVKVLNQNNAGTWSGVAQGILYATDHGADVINLSLGAAVSSQTLEAAIAYAHSHGVLVVAAAGNMGVDRLFYPAAIDGVIAVSATDAKDKRWSLSNFGEYIDVAAPGYAIYSTYHDLDNYYQGYTFMSGTSMASPFVAGLAGLLLSQDSKRTMTEITTLITTTADPMGDNLEDPYFGYGRINVTRALAVGADTEWIEVVEGEDASTLGDTNSTTTNIQLFLPVILR